MLQRRIEAKQMLEVFIICYGIFVALFILLVPAFIIEHLIDKCLNR